MSRNLPTLLVALVVIVMDDPGRVIYELDLKPPGALDVLGGEIAAGQEASGQ